jgi:hypothetical protein
MNYLKIATFLSATLALPAHAEIHLCGEKSETRVKIWEI